MSRQTAQIISVGSYKLAGVQDSNAALALGTTKFVQSATTGILIPEPIDANSNPVTSPVSNRSTAEITSTPLGSAATYTQAWQDANALGANYMSASVYTDQAGTLYADLADDQTNPMLGVQSVAITAATPTRLPVPQTLSTRYWRLRYVNGSTAQTTFELYQTIMAMLSPRDITLAGSNATIGNVGLNNRAVTIIDKWEAINYNQYDLGVASGVTYFGSVIVVSAGQREYIDVSAYEDIQVVFQNGTNEAYILGVIDGVYPAPTVNPVSTSILSNQSVAAGAISRFGSDSFGGLKTSINAITISLQTAATAPTSGAINLYLIGRPH